MGCRRAIQPPELEHGVQRLDHAAIGHAGVECESGLEHHRPRLPGDRTGCGYQRGGRRPHHQFVCPGICLRAIAVGADQRGEFPSVRPAQHLRNVDHNFRDAKVYGRRISILPALVGLSLFSVGTAVSRNAAAVLLTRFFGGIFGSAPVSNVAAALGDLYEPKARGIAVTFYAVCVVGGPTIGPVIGSALTSNPHFGWRWTEYIEAIWTFSFTVLSFFFMPELYAPVLLKRKACRLRKETGDPRYWHPHERAKISPSNILTKHLSRPLRMFVTEPMVTCIAVYASFVFALLYMTLEMFPMVYGREHIVPTYGFGPVVSTLPFLGLFVGVLGAMGVNLANQPRYSRIVAANKGRAVPEARLPPMLIGGVFFAGGIFWFGWTANPKYNWAIPTVATAFIGAGFNIIFQQCINFLVDTYALYAASAVSANTFLRSIFASGLPLAVRPMFARLGVGPSCSILGAVACTALPVPLLFMRYGASLRRRSKFAPAED